MKSPLTILFEDNHLLAVFKPAGMLSQGDKSGDQPVVDIMKNYIKERDQKPGNVFLGLVHRIDRPVSGVLLLAKTSKALSRMNALFQQHKVHKLYLAAVSGKIHIKSRELINYLKKDKDKNKVNSYSNDGPNRKKAILRYELVTHHKGVSLLLIYPKTGRSHQIRSQLAHEGLPILGDIKYGSQKMTLSGNILLHAFKLHFIHPVRGTPVTVDAGIPKNSDWNQFIDYDKTDLALKVKGTMEA